MSRISSVGMRRFVNKKCVSFLEWMEYEIDDDFKEKSLLSHLLLIVASLGMFTLSLVMLIGGVTLQLFCFHAISLFYKLIISIFESRAYKKRVEINRMVSSARLHSPYHMQGRILFIILFVLCVIMVVMFFGVIDFHTFFIIAIIFSMIITMAKELLDGLVSIYDAKASIPS